MQITDFDLDKLIPYARNPRKNNHAIDKMASAILEFGFRVPILAKSNGEVIDGHLRIKAAQKLSLATVPVVICDDLSEAKIKALRLNINRMAELADWDDDLLKLEIEELKEMDFDIDLLGFDKLPEFEADLPDDAANDKSAHKMILTVACENQTDLEDLFQELNIRGFKVKI